jgi:hypothetical protein
MMDRINKNTKYEHLNLFSVYEQLFNDSPFLEAWGTQQCGWQRRMAVKQQCQLATIGETTLLHNISDTFKIQKECLAFYHAFPLGLKIYSLQSRYLNTILETYLLCHRALST